MPASGAGARHALLGCRGGAALGSGAVPVRDCPARCVRRGAASIVFFSGVGCLRIWSSVCRISFSPSVQRHILWQGVPYTDLGVAWRRELCRSSLLVGPEFHWGGRKYPLPFSVPLLSILFPAHRCSGEGVGFSFFVSSFCT